MRRLALACLALALSLTPALAAWGAWNSQTAGAARFAASALLAGNSPAAGAAGSTVTLTWAPSHTSGGARATGYAVTRYDADGVEQPIAEGSCGSLVNALSCSETSVPDGTWAYAVTPTINGWRGATSARAEVTVQAGTPTDVTFPATGGRYNGATYDAGCGTPSIGDLCGTASPGSSGHAVQVVRLSLQELSSGAYWTGSAFSGSTEVPLDAVGTQDWSYAFPYTSLASEGRYLLRVRAIDAEGVVGTASTVFTVDSTAPPAPRVDAGPASLERSTSAALSFSDDEPDAGYQCRLDGAPFVPCTSPHGLSGLAEGPHTFEVRAVDAAGNASPATSRTWTVDTTAPTVALDFPAHGSSSNNARLLAGCGTATTGDVCGTSGDAGSGVATVRVSLRLDSGSYWNGSTFSSAFEVLLPASGTNEWSYGIAPNSFPAEGNYTLKAVVTDQAGNSTVASSTFAIDRTPPAAPSITSRPPSYAGSTASFSFTSEPGASFECALDGSAYAPCTSPRSYTGLADGAHTFDVRSVDGASNVGTPASYGWTTDTSAPVLTLSWPTAGARYNAAGWNQGCGTSVGDICGTASDGLSGVSTVRFSIQQGTGRYWDGQGFNSTSEVLLTPAGTASWSSPVAFSSLSPDGFFTVRAHATNGAGLTSTVTSTFSADTVAPTARNVGTTNVGVAGKAEQNDQLVLSYSEAVNPASLLAGWNGSATNVVVRINNAGSLTIWDTSNTTRLLAFGTVEMGRTDYTTANVAFGSAGGAPSTIVLNGDTVTVTLGAPSNASAVRVAGGAGTMTWSPGAVQDVAGNSGTPPSLVEPGPADVDF